MKFTKLNPVLVGNTLTLTCPSCDNRFSIYVNYQGKPKEPATWGLTHPENNFDWNVVTLTPSISNHPQARDKAKCNYHFSIINGDVIP